MLASTLDCASVVGFSGSRSVSSRSPLFAAVGAACLLVPDSASVLVGCAAGVDGLVRSAFPSARVFAVSSGCWGSGRGAFAARSAAFVRALALSGGVLLSFPALGSVPAAGLVPSSSSSRCFSGGGSGSWASLAFAVGSGVRSFVFLGSFSAPAGWGLVPTVGWSGWFEFVPAGVQLSLL
jgi:hypothetical protein